MNFRILRGIEAEYGKANLPSPINNTDMIHKINKRKMEREEILTNLKIGLGLRFSKLTSFTNKI